MYILLIFIYTYVHYMDTSMYTIYSEVGILFDLRKKTQGIVTRVKNNHENRAVKEKHCIVVA